ncbi:hypothetical protein KY361_05160 [Candidatus Woesearchaeota archaeon]|nr:hypothetical protein [Candidatus Woesearchaeota archaeon]
MEEELRTVGVGFSTADAEFPKITKQEGKVILKYKDWREEDITVHFHNVIAIKWVYEEFDERAGERDDTYEVLNSKWLKALNVKGKRHYKLCFNSIGDLDVICDSFEDKSSKSQQSPIFLKKPAEKASPWRPLWKKS